MKLTRPYMQISQWYKVVIYTASMAEYADPVIDWLDQDSVISQRFFRQVKYNKNIDCFFYCYLFTVFQF